MVNGTGAEANIEALDTIFSRHGYCESLTTDGGPPFNGKEYHILQKYFRWAGIRHHTTTSADDPEANGLAEAFMKHLAKIWHTAYIQRLNPVAEMNKHLQMTRATPHPTTGKSPAELMYGRKFRTRIPHIYKPNNRDQTINEARESDVRMKEKQKHYKDKKPYVKPHCISIGDNVQLAQKKTKMSPPYDPSPYKVTGVRGHQITAEREERAITRDAQKWKRLEYNHPEEKLGLEDEADAQSEDEEDEISIPDTQLQQIPPGNNDPLNILVAPPTEHNEPTEMPPPPTERENQPRRNPPRTRKPPSRYQHSQ